jgi:hypothetical protein
MRALAAYRKRAAGRIFTRALDAEDPYERFAAALGLARLGKVGGLRVLREGLDNPDLYDVATPAADFLTQLLGRRRAIGKGEIARLAKWVDANPADRPYRGAKKDDPFYDVARLMVRVTFNPGYPRGVTMLKHAFYMSTPRTVRAQKTRKDGRALAARTGYQASFRHGSQQSITRGWAPPMHQTDTLFHKKATGMSFVFGFDVDNHAINTVPKETLIRITKAESGGIDGNGAWERSALGFAPGEENAFMKRYIAGKIVTIHGGT